MWSYSQRDDIELRNSILPEWDGLRLKIGCYFEGELQYRSAMLKHHLINDKQNYQEVKFGEVYLSITTKY